MDRKENALNHRRARLTAWVETIEVPTRPRKGENREERGLRLIESTILRIELADASEVFAMGERIAFEQLRQSLIGRRSELRRAAKLSRGDF